VTISQYLESIKERLLTDPVITGFQLIRERTTLIDGYLRGRLTLRDNSQLEFSEYVGYSPSLLCLMRLNIAKHNYR
jgi:hypothetical protein